ncbi:MAG: ATP-grasp domain-containing protein [Prolixibacteraceae bacterium]|nr:ATP-grasp domain-containing protein [Prolixibacteraceae bacterium]
MIRKFNKIAIANRGEIALRIIRAARDMQIQTLAFFSDEEKNAPHVLQADEAYSLGSGDLNDTYLNIEKIIKIAVDNGADAVHPGYGFLSENPNFADACQRAGLIFIGPSVEVLKQMGNKVTAKAFAKKAGVYVLESFLINPAEVDRITHKLDYPLLIKASNGGGGKGMQVVYNASQLAEKAAQAARSALNYFGSNEIYIENYIENARHIEVQVLGDAFGNVVHLFERDCTIQRNHQKIIEEAPALSIPNKVRHELHNAALAICKEVKYENAGTVEFLVDANNNYFFLEMNPRIQVEHPVTEAITGVDIVKEQICIAQGKPLSFTQNLVQVKGFAVEARLYSEDPQNGFLPSGQPIMYYSFPKEKTIRVESAVDMQNTASQYDPLICKLIVWAENREFARKKMLKALNETIIAGPVTNQQYLKTIFLSENYINNQINTQFCHTNAQQLNELVLQKQNETPIETLLAAALFLWFRSGKEKGSIWEKTGFWRQFPSAEIAFGDKNLNVYFRLVGNELHFQMNKILYSVVIHAEQINEGFLNVEYNGQKSSVSFFILNSAVLYLFSETYVYVLKNKSVLEAYPAEFDIESSDENSNDESTVFSNLFGRVVHIAVKKDQTIYKGDVLMIIESMKSENKVLAPFSGRIKKINVETGNQVTDKMPLLYIENL